MLFSQIRMQMYLIIYLAPRRDSSALPYNDLVAVVSQRPIVLRPRDRRRWLTSDPTAEGQQTTHNDDLATQRGLNHLGSTCHG